MTSIYANLLEQKKAFALEKCSTPKGLVWDTNMAAVSLFCDTNMAAVTHVKTLYTRVTPAAPQHTVASCVHASLTSASLPSLTLHLHSCFRTVVDHSQVHSLTKEKNRLFCSLHLHL